MSVILKEKFCIPIKDWIAEQNGSVTYGMVFEYMTSYIQEVFENAQYIVVEGYPIIALPMFDGSVDVNNCVGLSCDAKATNYMPDTGRAMYLRFIRNGKIDASHIIDYNYITNDNSHSSNQSSIFKNYNVYVKIEKYSEGFYSFGIFSNTNFPSLYNFKSALVVTNAKSYSDKSLHVNAFITFPLYTNSNYSTEVRFLDENGGYEKISCWSDIISTINDFVKLMLIRSGKYYFENFYLCCPKYYTMLKSVCKFTIDSDTYTENVLMINGDSFGIYGEIDNAPTLLMKEGK